MSKFILKSTKKEDIIFSGEIISINISPYIEKENCNNEVAHLLVKTEKQNFLFRICKTQEQGNVLDIMISNIKKHFKNCLKKNKDYIIDIFEERNYIYVLSDELDEYYNERYHGTLQD